jgi:hypothetical protein
VPTRVVVLGVAYEAGVFTTAATDANGIVGHLFSDLVILALANTFLMPVALRFVLRRHGGRAAAPSSGTPPDFGNPSG